jgi:hypothetical protein
MFHPYTFCALYQSCVFPTILRFSGRCHLWPWIFPNVLAETHHSCRWSIYAGSFCSNATNELWGPFSFFTGYACVYLVANITWIAHNYVESFDPYTTTLSHGNYSHNSVVDKFVASAPKSSIDSHI